MAKEGSTALRLGLFMIAGTAVLILGLYLLGSKRGLFSSSMRITAEFHHVGGLRPGNNVRYAGINVGTVEKLTIMNDTVVLVEMALRESESEHIRSNAIASIGSDGLMGNKLVNIEPGDGSGPIITDGVSLRTAVALDTDAMLQTLDITNDNLAVITMDLRALSNRLSKPGNVLDLLADTSLAMELRSSLSELHGTIVAARSATERINGVVGDITKGKGALGTLIADPKAQGQVAHVLSQLQQLSDSLSSAAGEVDRFAKGLNAPEGLGHLLTQDTATTRSVKRTITNLERGTELLNEDLKALQRNWFFRKYFKEKEKEGNAGSAP